MRLRRWRVGFSHFFAIAQITLSSGKVCVLFSERDGLCAVGNEAALLLI
jgi:hypothetical protein